MRTAYKVLVEGCSKYRENVNYCIYYKKLQNVAFIIKSHKKVAKMAKVANCCNYDFLQGYPCHLELWVYTFLTECYL